MHPILLSVAWFSSTYNHIFISSPRNTTLQTTFHPQPIHLTPICVSGCKNLVFSNLLRISFSIPYLLCWHCIMLNQGGYCFRDTNALRVLRSNSSSINFVFIYFRMTQNKGSGFVLFCFAVCGNRFFNES